MGGRPVNADELLKLSELIAKTARDITAREVAPLLDANEKLSKLVAGLTAKVIELDKRKPEKGERGEKGEKGEIGPTGLVGEIGPAGQAGADGKDGAPGPQGERGEPGERGEKGERGDEGPVGRDGRDSMIPGPQGPAGERGEKGDRGDAGPKGDSGLDGFGFDDFEVVHSEDMREITLRYIRGDDIKEFKIPLRTIGYCGAWKEGRYLLHDAVTYSGNLWIARRDTTEKPADGNKDWQLAVRKGRDGKDGEPGKQGPIGPAGKDGRDLTKW